MTVSAKEFPNIRPSSRSFTPGEYPSTTFESLDGTKTHLRYGNKRVNATLTLGFSNINDSEVGLILDNYDDVMSVYDFVKFKDENAAVGIDAGTYRQEIRDNAGTGQTKLGLRWRYDGPPQVTSVYLGRSNVECKFVACLDSP
tara:strand:- start:885 stop:1313 length:429 start_codon:yes stop_codon:yes gene_type:complete